MLPHVRRFQARKEWFNGFHEEHILYVMARSFGHTARDGGKLFERAGDVVESDRPVRFRWVDTHHAGLTDEEISLSESVLGLRTRRCGEGLQDPLCDASITRRAINRKCTVTSAKAQNA